MYICEGARLSKFGRLFECRRRFVLINKGQPSYPRAGDNRVFFLFTAVLLSQLYFHSCTTFRTFTAHARVSKACCRVSHGAAARRPADRRACGGRAVAARPRPCQAPRSAGRRSGTAARRRAPAPRPDRAGWCCSCIHTCRHLHGQITSVGGRITHGPGLLAAARARRARAIRSPGT